MKGEKSGSDKLTPAIGPMAPTPFLARFWRDLLALAAAFLLPAQRERSRNRAQMWRAAVMLGAAALLALGTTALLVAGAALGVERLLGPQGRSLVFPYLASVLGWTGQGTLLILAAAAVLIGGGVLLLAARIGPARLQRRWWALAALLTLLVIATAVDVAFTEGNGAVMDALNQRSAHRFWSTAGGLIAIYLLTLPIQFLNTYGQQRWALSWRNASTTALVQSYLAHQWYYHLQADPERVERLDNPDQRIADDVPLAVESATNLFFGFCGSLLALGAYILVLVSISPVLVLTLALATAAGNGLILPLVRHLGDLSFRQQTLEADYRFALVHVRSHAESLAFLRGEEAVSRGLAGRFTRLLANLERLIRWRTLVGQSTGLYAFAMQFAPYLALSAAYFSGGVSLGDLTVGSLAFAQVQASLSFLIDRAEAVSGLFASLRRLADLRDELATPGPLPRAGDGHIAALPSAAAAGGKALASAAAASGTPAGPGADACLRLRDLCVAHPGSGRLLIHQLQLELPRGGRLLITGPSGSGKTTLLRVLAGLAPAVAGQLELPPPEQTLVLPQQPFLPLGSLREQLLFPGHGPPAEDAALRQLLERVGLQELGRQHADLAVVDDWGRVLSGGEQQRIGFARLLLRRPALAILDEASSALDLASEAQLHDALWDAVGTVVSVGHRPSLRRFHGLELRLDGQGGWRLEPIPPGG